MHSYKFEWHSIWIDKCDLKDEKERFIKCSNMLYKIFKLSGEEEMYFWAWDNIYFSVIISTFVVFISQYWHRSYTRTDEVSCLSI